MPSEVEINRITEKIIGAAIEVHRTLGPGLLESTYQACPAYELRQRGLDVETEKELPVVCKGVKLDCGYRIDLRVNQTIIVELKAVDEVTPVYDGRQLLLPQALWLPGWTLDQLQRSSFDSGHCNRFDVHVTD